MTKQRRRPNQDLRVVKALLVTGSVIATVAGTQLLPQQDAARGITTVETTDVETTTVVIPSEAAQELPLPPGDRRTQVELKPIPQVVQPQIRPVARSRSSR